MEEGSEHTSLLVKVRRTCCRLASAESELVLACLPRNGLFAGFGDHARQELNADGLDIQVSFLSFTKGL